VRPSNDQISHGPLPRLAMAGRADRQQGSVPGALHGPESDEARTLAARPGGPQEPAGLLSLPGAEVGGAADPQGLALREDRAQPLAARALRKDPEAAQGP